MPFFKKTYNFSQTKIYNRTRHTKNQLYKPTMLWWRNIRSLCVYIHLHKVFPDFSLFLHVFLVISCLRENICCFDLIFVVPIKKIVNTPLSFTME